MSGRSTRPGARAGWLAALAAGLCACASVPQGAQPIQYLDPNTGVTFMVVARPLVFARARPQYAARVRDYATVSAAYLDRTGHIEYLLVIYFWSTLDPLYEPGAAAPPADVMLLADDRRIPLQPLSDPAQLPPPVDRPPVRHYEVAMYRTDLATLRYLTTARYLALRRSEGGREVRFALWDDSRASLKALTRSAQ